jgi:acetyltransferase-like isoleucine patch superfamily enzyme
MKRFIRKTLSVVSRQLISKRFIRLSVGFDSSVDFWRVKSNSSELTMTVGCGCQIEGRITFERAGASVQIGERTYIGNSVISCANEIVIGDDVMVAWGAAIFDHGSHSVEFSGRRRDVELWKSGHKDWSAVDIKKTSIGDKSWIGYSAILLPGITIGEGAVVGAGSVVTRDVEPWTVVAGNPAKVVRKLTVYERV